MPRPPNQLTLVANDLAEWLDATAGQLADAMTAGGAAPFAAQVTEQDKIRYYSQALFNPDGTPNLQGRTKEMQRLGPEGFAGVYRAVLKAHPEFAVPSPPPGAAIPPPLPAGPTGGY